MSDDEPDVTRLGPSVTPSKSSSGRSGVTSTGWLSSSGDIDHGRFEPGTLLGGRYRIIGRLGRGGMGEVYRADDLKLGQPVALKFLPPEVDRDPARLTQLHTEVRMARQVSHPNVCRVYDIDEVEGTTFLSMEYVDGEDLSSLLRRIGRFPEERGLEIARQICSGLAAAHERGVIHRDFKPANVMVDSSGRVRITDFGLAGVSGEAIRAGTPAYMAPEQLAGGEVTARSDIYALGLVLYETFTGKRALEGNNLAELIHKREQSGIAPPTTIVRDLSEEIDTAVMRCLRPSPADRPGSALTVAGLLPGGDPLAAAIAAGETPSPEMVAAAGTNEALSLRAALAGAGFVVLSLLAIVLMFQRVMLVNRTPPAKSPAALQDRAEEALQRLGYGRDVGSRAWGLGMSQDFARYVAQTSQAPDRWGVLSRGRPETFYLWYRTSPRTLVPFGDENTVSGSNPPLTVAGMTLVVVDGSGRLSEFLAVPQPLINDNVPAQRIDWSVVFSAAGLEMSTFKEVDSQWVPTTFADERRAWEGPLPEHPGQTFRVEAAALSGRPVSFALVGPWSRSARSSRPLPVSRFASFVNTATGLVMPALMLSAVLLAWRNLKWGRGDRKGALRAATVLFVFELTAWLLGRHTGVFTIDMYRAFAAIGRSLFDAGLLWLAYLGLEPYIRRFSPDSLIGWTRLTNGRWRDPQVASDILLGICAGLAMTLFYGAHNLIPPLFGRPEPMPLIPDELTSLTSVRFVIARMLDKIATAMGSGMLAVAGVLTLLILLGRKWAAHIVSSLIFVWVVIAGMFSPGTPVLTVLIGLGIISVWTGVILYGGLLATVAALATHFILLRAPITTDFSSWRATPGLTYLLVIGGAGLLAAYLARTAVAQAFRPRAVNGKW